MKKIIFVSMVLSLLFACEWTRPRNDPSADYVITDESDAFIAQGYYKDLDDLPRRLNFSEDGLRLVTGGGKTKKLYDFSNILKVELEFSQNDYWAQLEQNFDTEVEVPAKLTHNGEELPANVGVSFRGMTSYRMNNTPKKSFGISLDFEDEDQDISGYESLNLNSSMDDSYLRWVIYERINRKYIPALSLNYVDLYINGERWGLYVNTQQLDNDYIKEWFLSKSGTRWRAEGSDGFTPGFGKGSSSLNYLGESPSDYEPHYTIKKTALDDPWTGLIDACSVLNNTALTELEKEIGEVMDLDRTIWFLVMENIFADDDGYIFKGGMDYYLYFDPITSWLTPLEYDGNSVLGSRNLRWSPFYREDDEQLPLLNRLLSVPNIRQRYLAHMRTVLSESFNPTAMNERIDNYAAKISDYMQDDPQTSLTYAEFQSAVSTLKSNIQTRHSTLMSNAEVAVNGLDISDVQWAVNGSAWAIPSPSDPVAVTAKVSGDSTVGIVYAYLGTGVVGPFSKMKLYDDGEHGDGSANDGVYGIIVPAQPSGTRMRFYIEAISDDGIGTRTYFPARAAHDVFTWAVE